MTIEKKQKLWDEKFVAAYTGLTVVKCNELMKTGKILSYEFDKVLLTTKKEVDRYIKDIFITIRKHKENK